MKIAPDLPKFLKMVKWKFWVKLKVLGEYFGKSTLKGTTSDSNTKIAPDLPKFLKMVKLSFSNRLKFCKSTLVNLFGKAPTSDLPKFM